MYMYILQAETYMVKYGRSIFKHLPDKTTDTLTTLCTDWPVGKTTQPLSTHGSIAGPSGNNNDTTVHLCILIIILLYTCVY